MALPGVVTIMTDRCTLRSKNSVMSDAPDWEWRIDRYVRTGTSAMAKLMQDTMRPEIPVCECDCHTDQGVRH